MKLYGKKFKVVHEGEDLTGTHVRFWLLLSTILEVYLAQVSTIRVLPAFSSTEEP